MQDLKYNLIQQLEVALANDLSKEQLDKLHYELSRTLKDFDISPLETAVAIYDDSNEKAMNFIFGKMKLDGKSEGSIKQYRRATEKMLTTIGKNYKDVTYFDVLEYFAQLSRQVSKVSYNNYLVYINQFWNNLHDEGVIPVNPIKKIKRVKTDRVIKKSFTSAERDCLRDNADNLRDKAIFEVLYSTSCRISEIVGANRSDINGSELKVWSPKTRSEIVVFLDDSAKYYLDMYLKSRTDNDDALFVTLRNSSGSDSPSRVTIDAIQVMCRKLGKKTGIKVHPHKFRRSKATDLLNAGMPLQEVQKILNHKSPDTTTRYFCPDNELIKSDFKRLSA